MAALLAVSASMATLSAQTDVTAQYLTNPSFEADGNQGGTAVPTGWTLGEVTGGYTSYRPINNTTTPNGNLAVSDGIKSGAADGSCYLYVRTNWGASVCNLNQTTTALPAGRYTLTADVLNPYTQKVLPTFTMSVTCGETTVSETVKMHNPLWRELAVTFDVPTESVVTVNLKHEGNGNNGNGVFTLVDNLKLVQYTSTTLSNLIEEANAQYDVEKPGAETFAAAISAASQVAPGADFVAIAEAAETLKQAMEDFKAAQFVAPTESNYTSWITNADLETTSGGEVFMSAGDVWNSSIPSGWKVARVVNGGMNSTTNNDGQSGKSWELWGSSATETAGTLFQTIPNLPAGKYTLSGYVSGKGKVFAKVGSGKTYYSEEHTVERQWDQMSVSFVKSSAEDVVLLGGQTTGQWGLFDTFSLTCDALDLSALIAQRDAMIEQLRAYEGKVPAAYYEDLKAVISKAQEATTEVALSESVTTLTNTVNAIAPIVDAYAIASDLYNLCVSYRDNSTASEEGKATFSASIEEGKVALEAAKSVADIQTAELVLEAARQAYVLGAYPTNGITFDMTFKITNAAIASTNGWSGARTNSGEAYDGAPDNTYFDIWNATMNMTQAVSNLPEGVYSLKAATRAHADVTVGNIYVDADGVTSRTDIHHVGNSGNDLGRGWGWTTVNDIMVSSGNINVGFYAECGNGLWAGADNFTLTLVRAFTAEEKAQAYINALNATIARAEAINTTANVGEGAFQYSAASVEALQAAIATAKAVSTTDIETLVAANEALKAAMEAYQLNAPAEGEVFNVIIRTNDGYKFKDIPVAFREDGKTGMFFEPTYVNKPHMAQYVTFTKVEGADNYVLSTIFADGVERFMATGITSGEGNSTAQIRLTADKDKALVTKVIATETEGIYRLLNTEANAYIGCQDGDDKAQGGMYTNSGSHVDLALVAVEKPEVTLNVTEAGFATLVLPFKAEVPEGIKVYTTEGAEAATANGNRVLTLTEATEIAANTAYIVEGAAGTYTFTGVGAAYSDTYTTGLLTGTFVSMTAAADTYVLQVNNGITGFYHVAEGAEPTVAANRAYLTAPAGEAEVTAFVFGDIQTGIQGVEAAADTMVDVYTIDGVRVREGVKAAEALKGLAKGIYVVGGAKKAVK